MRAQGLASSCIVSTEEIVKALILLHLWSILAGGVNKVERVPHGGVCACLSIYLGLSDFCGEMKVHQILLDAELHRVKLLSEITAQTSGLNAVSEGSLQWLVIHNVNQGKPVGIGCKGGVLLSSLFLIVR